ncbi:MAG TPA: TonB-dependent receptor [Longimicrobiales bacterium]|nr:TonB-dependent receptor [Longimicrobiales bacterium]
MSPKLGIVWAPAEAFRIFGSFGHGFRAPSESQLFRQGRAAGTVDLRPVRANNLEIGAGGFIGSRVSYDVALYHMRKNNDLLTFTRSDGSTETVNAGETLHRGVEVGIAAALPADSRLDLAFSRAFHTYEQWSPRPDTDYSGNRMEAAPARTASASLTWSPDRWERANASLDVQHVGPYWMDAANTSRYEGHTTVALRAQLPVTSRVALFGRLTNALNERYAELARYTTARGRELAPGMPRALYVGARFR